MQRSGWDDKSESECVFADIMLLVFKFEIVNNVINNGCSCSNVGGGYQLLVVLEPCKEEQRFPIYFMMNMLQYDMTRACVRYKI